MAKRFPAGLEQGVGAFAEGAQSVEQAVPGLGVWVEDLPGGGVAGRDVNADAGAGVALVDEDGQAVDGVRVEGGQSELAGGGEVVGGAGARVGDPDREAGGSASTCTLPPCRLCLPEYRASFPASVRAATRSVAISVPSSSTNGRSCWRAAARAWCRSGAWAASTVIPSCRYR